MSSSTNWSGKEPFAKAILCKGESLIVEGEVQATRFHSVFVASDAASAGVRDQEDNLPNRFVALTLNVTAAHERMFENDGREVNYDLPTDSRKYRSPKLIEADKLSDLVENATGFMTSDRRSFLHPVKANLFDFFLQVDERSKQIQEGHRLRLFTTGSSVFVEKFSNKDGKIDLGAAISSDNQGLATNLVGKVTAHQGALPGEDQEGCDSDEWSE